MNDKEKLTEKIKDSEEACPAPDCGIRGEFRADVTRDTFNPLNHFSRVIMQQGRVQLDADWNEQVSIMQHYLRSFIKGMMGPHGTFGERDNEGECPNENFKIAVDGKSVSVAAGNYYVNGLLCENECMKDFDIPDACNKSENGDNILVYLDVWEQHITYISNDSIREVALGGSDTATRAKLMWAIWFINLDKFEPGKDCGYSSFLELIKDDKKPGCGKLIASVEDKSGNDKEPCTISPESSYRGKENQLYRVEVHQGGQCDKATFKWSRENSSVIFPVRENGGTIIKLEHLGRDDRYSLKSGDWVEIIDDDYYAQDDTSALWKIKDVDREDQSVTFESDKTPSIDIGKNPYLRRWDHQSDNELGVEINKNWMDLEEGIKIRFSSEKETYQAGDYWLIPARTATGNIEWPGEIDEEGNQVSKALPPHGVEHHYAPLALLVSDKKEPKDLRRVIKQSSICCTK